MATKTKRRTSSINTSKDLFKYLDKYQQVQYVKNNKEADNDWFRLESNKEGTRWWGKAWTIQDMLRYEFYVDEYEIFFLFIVFFCFKQISVTYPMAAPEIAIPDLDGKTAKMNR